MKHIFLRLLGHLFKNTHISNLGFHLDLFVKVPFYSVITLNVSTFLIKPVTLPLRKLKQEDQEFKASFRYILF